MADIEGMVDAIDIYASQRIEFPGLDLPKRRVGIHYGGVVDQQIGGADGSEQVSCPIGYLNIVTDIRGGKVMGCRVFPPQGFDLPGIAPASGHGMTGGYQFPEHGAPQAPGNAGQDDDAWCGHSANS